MGEEGKLKAAVDQSNVAAMASEAVNASIKEWKTRIAPVTITAVHSVNRILGDVGISLNARAFVSQILITRAGTLEFPGLAIDTGTTTKRDSILSRPTAWDPAFEQLSLSEPYLDVRLDPNSRVFVAGRGCTITRAGNFSLEQCDETQIKETILEFSKVVLRSLGTS
jgi:hypothetical protein